LLCFTAGLSGCGLVVDYDYQVAEEGAAGSAAAGASHGSGGGSSGASIGGGGLGPTCPRGETCNTVPAEWDGPVALYAGSDPAPDCGMGWSATDKFAGNVAGSVTCTACECSGPVGGSCGQPLLVVYSDTCSTVGSQSAIADGQCGALPTSNYYEFQPAPVIAGQCTASGGVESKGEVSWDAEGRFCAHDDAGARCGGGGVCSPAPAPGLTWPCISRDGDHACPPGFDASTATVYSTVDDTRACSACSCSVQGASCPGTVIYQPTSSCSGGTNVQEWSVCYSIAAGYWKYTKGSAVPGSCAPSGGQPIGGVAPASPITVCCGAAP